MTCTVAKMAEMLLDIGLAVSMKQAVQMAEIVNTPTLSDEARDSLLIIARRVGAEFDIADITQDQIKSAVNDVTDARQKLYLALVPSEGSA
jgi:hypothetical protein